MDKVNPRIVKIFSHAISLHQSGRLRNTIYCLKNKIFILNQDHTILLKFLLRGGESIFNSPISFNANDYDSKTFHEEGNKICFVRKEGEYIREKRCKPTEFSPVKISKLFKQYFNNTPKINKVTLDTTFVQCLQEDLSHIEFSSKEGQFSAVQRNIYSGTTITIKKQPAGGLGILQNDNFKNFAPIGMRTNDFIALFTFANSITLYFPPKSGIVIVESNDKRMLFVGVMSQCMYDELGKV